MPCNTSIGVTDYALAGWYICGKIQEEDLFSTLPALDPEISGWMHQVDGSYVLDRWCLKLQNSSQDNINLGGSCRIGSYFQRCGCRKNKHSCGPGCHCQGCTCTSGGEPQTCEVSKGDNKGDNNCDHDSPSY